MTQDEIIEMAQEYKLIGIRPHLDGIYSEALVAFAKLVAAKEREACAEMARIFYDQRDGVLPFKKSTESNKNLLALEIEDAIRARGEQA